MAETAVKERPIVFTGDMVRATLAGRKTMARRKLEPQPSYPGVGAFVFCKHPFAPSAFVGTPAEGVVVAEEKNVWCVEDWATNLVGIYGDCPYGVVGDRLWVKEDWFEHDDHVHAWGKFQSAEGEGADDVNRFWTRYAADGFRATPPTKWYDRAATDMPRWASRFTLEISAVWAKPLQDMEEVHARAEGVTGIIHDVNIVATSLTPEGHMLSGTGSTTWIESFRKGWNERNPDHDWDTNPWVWVIEFRRVK